MKKVYWKTIPGYEGLYEASNYGDIKSLNYNHTGKERILKIRIRKNGYIDIGLCKNNKQIKFEVHKLVCMAFLGHVADGHIMVIDHEDNDGTNNYIGTPEGEWKDGNLHIVSHRDNISTCARKDRYTKSSPLTGASWSKSHNKWTSQYVYQGKKYNIGQFDTDKEASDKWYEAYEADKNGTFEIFNSQFKRNNILGINQYSKNGEFIRTWNRIKDIYEELNISKGNICSCCKGKYKSAGGYVWKYKYKEED